MTKHVRLLAFGVAASVFLLDRLTKILIRREITTWDTYAVIPGFFNLIHTENPGAAFSLLASSQSEWRTFFLIGLSAAALVLIGFLLWQPGGRVGHSLSLRLGLALLMGGALGNMYDRIARNAVTDFLEFYIADYRWPAFNIADMGITIGAALVILDMIRTRRSAATTTT